MRDLEVKALFLLFFAAHSGYSLHTQLITTFNRKVSFGSVYPLLRRLHEKGLVSTPLDFAFMQKRLYTITPLGREQLRRNISELICLTRQLEIALKEEIFA
jgi:DNA-binding PadR family transcriptional regulator